MLLLLRSRLLLLVLGGLGFLTPGCSPPPSAPGDDPPPPGFSLRDVAGVEHHPFTGPAAKAVALVFVLADCPIANGYAPEINRLCAAYGPRGVRFFLVQVDEDLSSRAAAEHAREYGYTCPVVLDGGRALVRRAGARLVPAYGKKAGDWVNFGGLFGEAPVMKVSEAGSEAFVGRGGRIPAPLQGLTN